jgi:diketogulonate reductase-like aldo/keto reductase
MPTRRQLLQLSGAALLAARLPAGAGTAEAREAPTGSVTALIRKPIPASGELLPVIGMGTSRTFDTTASEQALRRLTAVMQAFFAGGGTVIDSSPMYGAAEARVGDVLRQLPDHPPVFGATKVWTEGREAGIAQMQASSERMGIPRFDLIQVHNLVDWRTQLDTLKRWKAEGMVRYIGITTSHQRYHEEFARIMREEPIDFAQFSYNIEDREAERQLLPLAAERGIATLVNRPFQRGALFRRVGDTPLPPLAGELGIASWGQFFLKFAAGHPAVTCLIPATSKPHHMADNMGANHGRLPDARERQAMLAIFNAL